jgi:hypothetical protein
MCKTNLEMNIYYANICKHEHENNMTRLWCKIVPKINVEQNERNEGSYSLFLPLWEHNSKKFSRRFLCVHKVRKLFGKKIN